MLDKKYIILNKNIRHDVLKYSWSRYLAIKYGKLKYVDSPYTKKDLLDAITYNQFEMVKLFHIDCKNVGSNILNFCIYNFEIFKYFYDYFPIDTEINVKLIVEYGHVDIVKFLYERDYITDNDYNVNTYDNYKFLLEKNISFDMGEQLILELIKNGESNFSLSDAIFNEYMDIINYFLDNDHKLSVSDVCGLINCRVDDYLVSQLNLDNEAVSSPEIAMHAIESGRTSVIEYLINNGFDQDELLQYCKDVEDDEMYLWIKNI